MRRPYLFFVNVRVVGAQHAAPYAAVLCRDLVLAVLCPYAAAAGCGTGCRDLVLAMQGARCCDPTTVASRERSEMGRMPYISAIDTHIGHWIIAM